MGWRQHHLPINPGVLIFFGAIQEAKAVLQASNSLSLEKNRFGTICAIFVPWYSRNALLVSRNERKIGQLKVAEKLGAVTRTPVGSNEYLVSSER